MQIDLTYQVTQKSDLMQSVIENGGSASNVVLWLKD